MVAGLALSIDRGGKAPRPADVALLGLAGGRRMLALRFEPTLRAFVDSPGGDSCDAGRDVLIVRGGNR